MGIGGGGRFSVTLGVGFGVVLLELALFVSVA